MSETSITSPAKPAANQPAAAPARLPEVQQADTATTDTSTMAAAQPVSPSTAVSSTTTNSSPTAPREQAAAISQPVTNNPPAKATTEQKQAVNIESLKKKSMFAGAGMMLVGLVCFFSDKSHPILALGRKILGLVAAGTGAFLSITAFMGGGDAKPAAPGQPAAAKG